MISYSSIRRVSDAGESFVWDSKGYTLWRFFHSFSELAGPISAKRNRVSSRHMAACIFIKSS